MQKLLTRKSNRLSNYNYSDNGYYFITVCSNNRKNIFGRYKNTVGAPLASSAPTIIRSFKSKSTMEYLKYIKQNNLNISGKIWQRSFHDHVIRNERSLNAIREYISNNPENWEQGIDNLINL